VSWDQEINADVDFRLAYAFADIDRDSFYGGLGDVVTDPSAPGYDPSQLDPNVAGSAASRSWRQYGRTHNPLHYIDSQLNWRLGAHALGSACSTARGAARRQPHR
jgi:outer membrane receptor for ferrienterochelin and colicins